MRKEAREILKLHYGNVIKIMKRYKGMIDSLKDVTELNKITTYLYLKDGTTLPIITNYEFDLTFDKLN